MRVYIVDDEPIVRAGLRQIFSSEPDLVIAGEAGSAREAFRNIESTSPDVAVVDLVLPGMDGTAATRDLRGRVPGVPVLVLTIHARLRDVLDAFAAGATGFALKTEPLPSLIAALRTVAKGQRYISPTLAPLLEKAPRPSPSDVLDRLSVREREVFQLITGGVRIVEASRELCISRKTVETHIYRLYRKLGCHNLGDLVRFAAQHDLLRTVPQGPDGDQDGPARDDGNHVPVARTSSNDVV